MYLERHPHNPIITRDDIPADSPQLADVTSVFNPGAVVFNDQILLMLRVQNRGRETYSVLAKSDDGVNFKIDKYAVFIHGMEKIPERVYHIYDTRITRIGEMYYIIAAMDMETSCKLGLIKTRDFETLNFMGIISQEDNRNGVLFPEKIGGKYVRFDRPNELGDRRCPASGSAMIISESLDLIKWNPVTTVIKGRRRYWDEFIGAGPPPVKTREGWLQIYHGIATHFASANIYQAGAALLNLDNPVILKARTQYNILEPRELYELVGQVPNVVFPTGIIVRDLDDEGFARMDSEVLLYYGAADTCVCLAVSSIERLIEACYE